MQVYSESKIAQKDKENQGGVLIVSEEEEHAI